MKLWQITKRIISEPTPVDLWKLERSYNYQQLYRYKSNHYRKFYTFILSENNKN